MVKREFSRRAAELIKIRPEPYILTDDFGQNLCLAPGVIGDLIHRPHSFSASIGRARGDGGFEPGDGKAKATCPNPHARIRFTIFPSTSVNRKFLPWNLYVSRV